MSCWVSIYLPLVAMLTFLLALVVILVVLVVVSVNFMLVVKIVASH